MARMIPSVISPEIKSTAERRIFNWFKTCKGTENWIVLHSLGIANHSKVIFGEIDFFVLAPGLGLFAIEVKGGRVSRKEGIWSFTNKYGVTGHKERGPFDQAWDGVHSIVRDIKSKLDSNHRHLNRLLFGIGVMFPDIKYTARGSDELQWQVFDVNDGIDILSFIKRLSSGASDKYVERFNCAVPAEGYMSTVDVSYIADLLRGDFDRAVTLSALIKTADKEMIKLTEEQFRCIDQLEDNPRCLVRGGAGTGKTLVAMQETLKAVAKDQAVAMICFNSNLGQWLSHCLNDPCLRPSYVGTFHKFLVDVLKQNDIQLSIPKDEESQQIFYRETLPDKALNVLRDSGPIYDLLIVDEAQDLINERYLNVLDSAVTGGLSRGCWRMFGDFSMQAIYYGSQSPESMLSLLDERTSFINFRLTVNCRNTKQICEEICTVTGYEPRNEMWMKVDGPPVNYVTYSNADDGGRQLLQVIEDLIGTGISPEKITVLSPKRRESSIVNRVDKYKIANYRADGNETISFCTIQGYKGLENTVIILADVNTFSNVQLMYVALSRATAGLYVIESNDAAKEYLSLQQRRFLG